MLESVDARTRRQKTQRETQINMGGANWRGNFKSKM
jgi:hypothetical protein